MEDLVRRYCSRPDAQGNAHTLAEDIHLSSLETLLPDDLKKHVQLNRARLTSYGVLREEIKTYCECGGYANARKRETERFITPRRRRPNGHWCIRQRQGQTKQRQARQGQRQRKARVARTAQTGQGQEQGQEQGFGLMLELWKARTLIERLPTMVVRRENTNPRMQMLTILTRNRQLLNQKSKSMNST